jgi:hypothetical protein
MLYRSFALGALVILTAGCLEQSDNAKDSPPNHAPAASDCPALPGTPAEIAQTPRAEQNLELLALSLSAGLTADQAVYDRVVRDVQSIRSLQPQLADVTYHPAYVNQIVVGASPDTLEEMDRGAYKTWDCLNQQYKLKSKRLGSAFMVLQFDGIFDLEQLSVLYAALPEITYAEPDRIVGDASSIYVTRDTSEWHYVLDVASDDCEAGCINHQLYYFVTNDGGAAEYVADWLVAPDTQAPEWVAKYWSDVRN